MIMKMEWFCGQHLRVFIFVFPDSIVFNATEYKKMIRDLYFWNI